MGIMVFVCMNKTEHLQHGLRVSDEKYYINPKDLMLRKMKHEKFFSVILND